MLWPCLSVSFLLLCALTVALAAGLDAMISGYVAWGGMEAVAADEREAHWCEKVYIDRFIRTPINAYSALAFVFCGYAIVAIVLTDRFPLRNNLRIRRGANYYGAVVLIASGVASFVNHSALTKLSREFDRATVWGMMTSVLFVVALRFANIRASAHVDRLITISKTVCDAVVLGSCLTFGCHDTSTTLIYLGVPVIAMISAIALLARPLLVSRFHLQRLRTKSGPPFLGIFLAVLGFVLQDPRTIGACSPGGPWYTHTHAFFHIAEAIALFMLWYTCWTEEELQSPD